VGKNIKIKLNGSMVWGCGLDSFGSGYVAMPSSFEHDNDPWGSKKCGKFLE
jgi:hypothetical protein